MRGAGVLYNTHWVRFVRGRTSFEQAVENSKTLFEAATQAGVGRIVHFSVANASPDSRLPYFRGKGQVEEITYGHGYPLRHHPAHPWSSGRGTCCSTTWPGRCGAFRFSPSSAEEITRSSRSTPRTPAAQAVDASSSGESFVADAAGPETFTFEELPRLLASSVGARVRLVHTPPPLGFRPDPAGGPAAAGRRADPRRG